MKCKICNKTSEKIFNTVILSKHKVSYFYCFNCGFLQTEEPYWLDEAYKESISVTDTGILSRNISLSKISSVIIFKFFNSNSKFLDYAGGYGTFTRLMRDIGFNFYWNDPFTKNLFARGFEYEKKLANEPIELLTSFESFEHFVDPVKEIGKMLSISKNILFSTIPLPEPVPKPEEWWYYGLENGQHISFYSLKTFNYLSQIYSMDFYS